MAGKDSLSVEDLAVALGEVAAQAPLLEQPLIKEESEPSESERFRPLTIAEVLSLELKPPESIAGDLGTAESLAMVYAPRGRGKTWFTWSLAVAIATGRQICDWEVPNPQEVLIVDGEMSPQRLQERAERLLLGCGAATIPAHQLSIDEYRAAPDTSRPLPRALADAIRGQLAEVPLRLLSHNYGHRYCGMGVPDLDTQEGRSFIDTFRARSSGTTDLGLPRVISGPLGSSLPARQRHRGLLPKADAFHCPLSGAAGRFRIRKKTGLESVLNSTRWMCSSCHRW